MKKILLLTATTWTLSTSAQNFTSKQFREDFDFFWQTINENYCYWDKKQTDWQAVKALYEPMADTISSRNSFVLFLEKLFNELYDHHASLNTNTNESQRLVPSGADIWAEYVNGEPLVIEVKMGSGAANAGIKAGMRLVAFNGVAVGQALLEFLPRSLKKEDAEAKNYALRVLLSGRHSTKREITVIDHGRQLVFHPDDPVNLLEVHSNKPPLESRLIADNIGYISINNSLGEDELVHDFDSAVQQLKGTKAMIIDLRNTPSGGITTVARAIMGRFINTEGFYQKHELTSEERESGVKRSWVEIVSPRKPAYQNPLAILVDHWTGSVSEGIAVGFDALKRATIIGEPMAALNGAIYSFKMPNTGIGFSFPAEKLFHVNGLPREKFQPQIIVNLTDKKSDRDLILEKAISYLRTKVPAKK